MPLLPRNTKAIVKAINKLGLINCDKEKDKLKEVTTYVYVCLFVCFVVGKVPSLLIQITPHSHKRSMIAWTGNINFI